MSVIQEVRELVVPVLDSLGVELFDLNFKKAGKRYLLRIFIDKEGGVSIDDCQKASKEISLLLDMKDAVPWSYNLEVSSPGINRPIRNEQDYLKYTGKKIKVRLFTQVSNQKTWIGINHGIEGATLRLEISPDQELVIPVGDIAQANLEFDF
jgi:ribosome maturation factor RimP